MMNFLLRGQVIPLLLAVALLLAACSSRPPTEFSPEIEPGVTETIETPPPATQTSRPSVTPAVEAYPLPEDLPYPAPELAASPMPTPIGDHNGDAYPLPLAQTENPPPPSLAPTAYPAPGSELPTEPPAYPAPPSAAFTPTGQPTQPAPLSGVSPSPPAGPEPTERVGFPAMPPPSSDAVTVRIWHSWSESEVVVLEDVLQAFQKVYPNVYFDVLYIPFDDMLRNFRAAAYRGAGPSILLAPAEWGPQLYNDGLVAAVDDLAVPAFLERINPAALDSARYRGALISLPHAIRNGVIMYRNRQIIPNAPVTFSDLVTAAKEATRGGRVGAYLERGYFYSAGHLAGLGGRLMDENGTPTFNDPRGLAWLNLLVEFEQAGPVSFNTNRDLDLFKSGRVGIIFDGTWSRESLAKAIGEENLVIDPWPAYGNGRLSGYVQADNIYLTTRAVGDERYASLQFFGFMLAPEVQAVLTRANHIPALIDVQVEHDWMRPVMRALQGGTAFPTHPNANLYWDPLETAMGFVFSKSALPAPALQQANDTINARIRDKEK
jgi:arabinogalactan oligomer / maltooligosaccharide transport system substrate-binding protein